MFPLKASITGDERDELLITLHLALELTLAMSLVPPSVFLSSN